MKRQRTSGLLPMIMAILLAPLVFSYCDRSTDREKKTSVTITGANALYPLVVEFAMIYQQENPSTLVSVQPASSRKGISGIQNKITDIGMYSGIQPPEDEYPLLFLPVAIDAVVTVTNSKNPALERLMVTGLDKQCLRQVFISREINRWNDIRGIQYQEPVISFIRSDASGASEVWAEFLDGKRSDLNGIGVYGDPGMTQSIRAETNSIGYDNLRFVFDNLNGKKYPGLEIIPIDFNRNGKIDNSESFYSTLKDFNEAVRAGKYPYPLARKLYFVISAKDIGTASLDFLLWAFSTGQASIESSGYVKLTEKTVHKQLEILHHLKKLTLTRKTSQNEKATDH